MSSAGSRTWRSRSLSRDSVSPLDGRGGSLMLAALVLLSLLMSQPRGASGWPERTPSILCSWAFGHCQIIFLDREIIVDQRG